MHLLLLLITMVRRSVGVQTNVGNWDWVLIQSVCLLLEVHN